MSEVRVAQTELIMTHLRMVLGALGSDGGRMDPSVYDTAQVLRLAPPAEGPWETLAWLIAQQQPDGGWGDPALPYFRDIPTLAAILAIQTYDRRQGGRAIVDDGLAFLRRQSAQWAKMPDNIPASAELILPYLLSEAAQMGLEINQRPYQALIALGERRRQLISQLPAEPGTSHIHSWEAWGKIPELWMIDPAGGVGQSPAATAAWVRAAAQDPELASASAQARHYLQQASLATNAGIPGVMPTAWPIGRFEQSFVLYTLLITGLLDHPKLADMIQPQIDDMAAALRPGGAGFSDFFMPDGGNTAAVLAVLHAADRPIDHKLMLQFARQDYFYAWPHELQPSILITAQAVHLLARCDTAPQAAIDYLIARQGADGRWYGDKWNASWLYTSWLVIVALLEAGAGHAAIERAIVPILALQDSSGGWGKPLVNAEETAYAVLALRTLLNSGLQSAASELALARGEQWMQHHYTPFRSDSFACWLAKEAYRAPRLSQAIKLAATIPQIIDQSLHTTTLGDYL
jgi:hypothetical protein